jgi:hypothetical protein
LAVIQALANRLTASRSAATLFSGPLKPLVMQPGCTLQQARLRWKSPRELSDALSVSFEYDFIPSIRKVFWHEYQIMTCLRIVIVWFDSNPRFAVFDPKIETLA